MKRIAVAGATGLAGRAVVRELHRRGHGSVALSRSAGVDVATGAGLDEALSGVDAVIDVVSTAVEDPAAVVRFFETAADTLLTAERRAGVAHHVLLSIVALDALTGDAHYDGKRAQERVVESGPVPWSILRASPFFDYAATVVAATTRDGTATVPPVLLQPVALRDVAEALVECAAGEPRGRGAGNLAGPDTHDLVDMARRTLAARGDRTRLRASWRDGLMGVEMAGEVLLPPPGARIGPTDFDTWLSEQRADHLPDT